MLKFNQLSDIVEIYDDSHKFLGWLKPNKFNFYVLLPQVDIELTPADLTEICHELKNLNTGKACQQ